MKKIHVPLVAHASPLKPHFKQKPEGIQLYEGDEGEVECVVDGMPFPTVTIMKGTRALVTGVHYSITIDNVTGLVTFLIKKAKTEDEGKYVVKLKAGAQEESAIFNVFVKGSSFRRSRAENLRLGFIFLASLALFHIARWRKIEKRRLSAFVFRSADFSSCIPLRRKHLWCMRPLYVTLVYLPSRVL